LYFQQPSEERCGGFQAEVDVFRRKSV